MRIRMAGACLVAALALGVMVSSASAMPEPPEYGRCVKVSIAKSGRYGNPVCTKTGGTKANEYEWLPGPGPKPNFKLKLKPKTSLSLVIKKTLNTMTCTGLTGSGHFVNKYAVSYDSLTLTGCKEGSACTSAGQLAGTIITGQAIGDPQWFNKAKKEVEFALGVQGIGESPWWAEWNCGTEDLHTIEESHGSNGPLRLVKPNKMLLTETAVWTGPEGEQKPSEDELGSGRSLKCQIFPPAGEYLNEVCALNMTVIQTNEEKMEINSVV
jgi:hypothetical protein